VSTRLGPSVTKLELRDHVQAVVNAYEAGVVDPRSTADTGATIHA
jgi:hypothetical protein